MRHVAASFDPRKSPGPGFAGLPTIGNIWSVSANVSPARTDPLRGVVAGSIRLGSFHSLFKKLRRDVNALMRRRKLLCRAIRNRFRVKNLRY
jgi:hypothetical protein